MTTSRIMALSKVAFVLLAVMLIVQVMLPAGLRAWRFDPLTDPVHAHPERVDDSAGMSSVIHVGSAGQVDAGDGVSTASVVSVEGRPLLFADDFDGASLDESKWNPHYWWRDDEDGCTIAPNNELQWYQPDDVIVADGTLKLRGQQRTVTTCDGEVYNFTSGVVTTGKEAWDHPEPDKFAFLYGYAEARLKMPLGQGLWPAFWLLSCDQEWPPEIDVMEFLGHKPTITHMTYHYLDDEGTHRGSGDWWTGPDFSSDWHTFAIDWRPDAIVWYVDGVERYRFTDATRIPHEPMYLVLNLAIGGDWPGPPNETTPFPSYFEADYVKVWSPTATDTDPSAQQARLADETSQS